MPTGTKLKVHQGDLTIDKAGTVVDGLDIRGFVSVRASGVTIKNSIVRGRDAAGATSQKSLITSTSPNVTIVDSELAPEHPSPRIDGLKGYGFTARRLNIHGAVDNVLIFGDNTIVENSWIHDNRHFAVDPNQNNTPSHDDSIQIEGGKNIVIRNNTLSGAWNAALMITQNHARTQSLRISGNVLGGGGCTINAAEKGRGPFEALAIENNVFRDDSRLNCPMILPSTTTPTLANNVYADSRESVLVRRN